MVTRADILNYSRHYRAIYHTDASVPASSVYLSSCPNRFASRASAPLPLREEDLVGNNQRILSRRSL